MMIWAMTMTGVAAIFWAVSIASRIEIRRLRKLAIPGNTRDKKDLATCIDALLEIREIEVPAFSACAKCKSPGQDSAWAANNLLCIASHSARIALREITTPVECEFCNEGHVACSSPNCFGGNTRDGDYCPVCRGSGAIRCEDCDGKGEC